MPALNTISRSNYRIKGKPNIRKFNEAASQTFKKGDLVALDTNGQVVIAATGGNVVVWTTNTQPILGLAKSAASGTTNAAIMVDCFNESTQWRVPVTNDATNVTGVTALGTVDGTRFQLLNHNTYGWMLNTATSTNGAFKIMSIDPKEPVGANNGYVWIKLDTAIDANNAPTLGGRF